MCPQIRNKQGIQSKSETYPRCLVGTFVNKVLSGGSFPLSSTWGRSQRGWRLRSESPVRRRNRIIMIRALYLCFFIIYLNWKSTKIAASPRLPKPVSSHALRTAAKNEGCWEPAPLISLSFREPSSREVCNQGQKNVFPGPKIISPGYMEFRFPTILDPSTLSHPSA